MGDELVSVASVERANVLDRLAVGTTAVPAQQQQRDADIGTKQVCFAWWSGHGLDRLFSIEELHAVLFRESRVQRVRLREMATQARKPLGRQMGGLDRHRLGVGKS